MKIDSNISKMILKKASSYFKISILLFIISLLLISSSAIFFSKQYINVSKNFFENNNAHIINIDGNFYSDESKEIRALNFNDIEQIKKISEEKYSDTKVFVEYQINGGVTTNGDRIFPISGIDDYGIKFLLNAEYEDDTLYLNNAIDDIDTLNIPVIEVKNKNEIVSHELVKIPIKANNNNIIPKNIFELYDDIPNKAYVSLNTYKKIIEILLNTTWDDFQKKVNDNVFLGIAPIKEVYVYSENLSYIEPISKELEKMGYFVNHAFKAFDDFIYTFSNTGLLLVIFIIAIFLSSLFNIIISLNSYFKIQKKDMGILKHYGYDTKRIFKIYKINLKKIFLLISVPVILYTLIAGLIIIGYENTLYMLISLACSIIPIFIVYFIVSQLILKKYTSLDILTLLKNSKEFE